MASDEPGVEARINKVNKPEGCLSQIRRAFKFLYLLLSSHIGLILILFAYAFIGGAIFQAIEAPAELKEQKLIREERDNLLSFIYNHSRRGNLIKNESLWTDIIKKELKRYEGEVQVAVGSGVDITDEDGDDLGDTTAWSFWGSVFFSATIFTTVGYGNITPVTRAGRITTMIYAAIGVPLCLIVLADIGKLFTRGIKFLWAFIRGFYYTGKCRKLRRTIQRKENSSYDVRDGADETDFQIEVDDEFNLPPLVAILIVIAYIFLGAIMYNKWEDWTYLEAFYFIFITISTIGFGDIVPEHPKYFMATSIYILFGLSLVAMVINVFMEVVNSTIETAKTKVHEATKKVGINLPEEDHVDDDVKEKTS